MASAIMAAANEATTYLQAQVDAYKSVLPLMGRPIKKGSPEPGEAQSFFPLKGVFLGNGKPPNDNKHQLYVLEDGSFAECVLNGGVRRWTATLRQIDAYYAVAGYDSVKAADLLYQAGQEALTATKRTAEGIKKRTA